MAKITNAFATADAIGNREDLTDKISMISPTDTPILTLCGKPKKAKNRHHEWQTDALAAPDGSNFHVEGNEESAAAVTPTTRIGNYCQISKKIFSVTNTQESVESAGRSSERGYQSAKKMKELKRDIETILTGVQGQAATEPRKSRGLESWLATNVDRGAGGADAAAVTASPTDGTQRAFTEDILKDVLQACYTAGAEPTVLSVGPHNKGVVSGFTGRSQARQTIDKERIQGAAHVYASDFGEIRVQPNRFQRERTAFFLDPEFIHIADLRPTHEAMLGRQGDAEIKVVRREWTLVVDNEAALGAAADLNTA